MTEYPFTVGGWTMALTIDNARALVYSPWLSRDAKDSLKHQIARHVINYVVWG